MMESVEELRKRLDRSPKDQIWMRLVIHEWPRISNELVEMRAEFERLKLAKDQMHDQRHEEARNADLLRDALAKTDAMFRAARDEAGRAHRKYSFLKIQRDQLQSAISRAIRLLPRDGAEEASTLEMMIEARGYLKEALRESGEVKE